MRFAFIHEDDKNVQYAIAYNNYILKNPNFKDSKVVSFWVNDSHSEWCYIYLIFMVIW